MLQLVERLQDLNVYSTCRTCLGNLNDMEIQYKILEIPELKEKFTACSSLPVEPEDGLPTSLCETCHTKIDDFYVFQQMCISAKERFLNYIKSERKSNEIESVIYPTTDFMFAVSKKKHGLYSKLNKKEDPMSPGQYSQLNDMERHFDGVRELVENQPPCDYNIRVQDKINKSIPDYMNSYKKSTVPLSKNNLQCEICNKCFKKNETFQVHLLLHQGRKPFPCQLCNKSYSRQVRLKLHIKTNHEGEPDKKFSCTQVDCDEIFSSKQSLRQHARDIHWKNGKKPKQSYVCEECGKVQISLDALKKHRYIHTGQQLPHQCPQCNKRFLSKCILDVHINRHNGIKNFTCPQCGAKKTTRMELKKHINSHTKDKKYPCQFCDMVYYSLYNLSRHKRIVHQGIKDFPCSYCEKSFGRSSTRKNHEMTHTGEKPHECKICKKKFIQIFSLKKHQQLHLKNGK